MRIIKKSRKHKAIWWKALGDTGRGYFAYDTPVEIDCRWDDVTDHRFDDCGVAFRCMAEVILDRKIGLGDIILYGKLADLKFNPTDPLAIPGIGTVKKLERYASLRQRDLGNPNETLHLATLGR
jgi:hypothetical protein